MKDDSKEKQKENEKTKEREKEETKVTKIVTGHSNVCIKDFVCKGVSKQFGKHCFEMIK